jgi:hypothetical protein
MASFLTMAFPAASRASMVSLALTPRWRRSPSWIARRTFLETRSVSVLLSPRAMKLPVSRRASPPAP